MGSLWHCFNHIISAGSTISGEEFFSRCHQYDIQWDSQLWVCVNLREVQDERLILSHVGITYKTLLSGRLSQMISLSFWCGRRHIQLKIHCLLAIQFRRFGPCFETFWVDINWHIDLTYISAVFFIQPLKVEDCTDLDKQTIRPNNDSTTTATVIKKQTHKLKN
jgi:hypothetical protein